MYTVFCEINYSGSFESSSYMIPMILWCLRLLSLPLVILLYLISFSGYLVSTIRSHWLHSVSYTHLDVYKRQLLYCDVNGTNVHSSKFFIGLFSREDIEQYWWGKDHNTLRRMLSAKTVVGVQISLDRNDG